MPRSDDVTPDQWDLAPDLMAQAGPKPPRRFGIGCLGNLCPAPEDGSRGLRWADRQVSAAVGDGTDYVFLPPYRCGVRTAIRNAYLGFRCSRTP